MMLKFGLRCVLFDLDGTLVDTAPDMVAALNRLRAEHDLEALTVDSMQCYVSRGARGLLEASMPDAQEDEIATWQTRFLSLYAADLCRHSRLFPHMDALLGRLEEGRVPWGVVTNKPHQLAHDLLDQLDLLERAACLVAGDTLAQRKPHPLPLLHACGLLQVAPDRTVFVGDDERDVMAGKAAGCRTMVARYGYIYPGHEPEAWGADEIAHRPEHVAQLLGLGPVPA